MSTPLIIYSHPECELCELAAGMATLAQIDWIYQDIGKDIKLLRRYRNCIPVIRNQETGEELFWPFGDQDIRTLAASSS